MLCVSHPVNVFALVCSLYVYGPRTIRGDATRACCSSCQPHPASNHGAWMFRWVQAAHLDWATDSTLGVSQVCAWWMLSWIQGETVCFMCPLDAANTGNSPSADPADWPLHVTDLMRTELIRRRWYHVPPDFIFPFCVFIIEQMY